LAMSCPLFHKSHPLGYTTPGLQNDAAKERVKSKYNSVCIRSNSNSKGTSI
jgi:hypothetical protein